MPRHRPSTVTYRARLLTEARAIMDEEYSSALSLDELARRIATSRRQLQRAFCEIGRTTFRGDLAAIRMDRAAELLAGTGLPVWEIADRVGYRQAPQFAKAFRRRHGLSPSDYRTAARNGALR
jgi:transcriptional regulator GlxA family with amidase domain